MEWVRAGKLSWQLLLLPPWWIIILTNRHIRREDMDQDRGCYTGRREGGVRRSFFSCAFQADCQDCFLNKPVTMKTNFKLAIKKWSQQTDDVVRQLSLSSCCLLRLSFAGFLQASLQKNLTMKVLSHPGEGGKSGRRIVAHLMMSSCLIYFCEPKVFISLKEENDNMS